MQSTDRTPGDAAGHAAELSPPGQSAAGQSAPGQSPAGQSAPGQSPAGQSPAGRSRAARLEAALTAAFAPEVLRIDDDSARHAGHAGARPGGQTHYSVLVVSAAFRGMPRVARSRAVHAALAREFAEGMHALALTLRTPEEVSAGQQR